MTISPLATIKNAYISMAPDGVVAEITDEMVGKRVDFILLFDAPILTTGPIKFGGPLAQLFGTDQLVPIIAGPTFLIFNEVVFDVDANFEDVYISILSGVTDALGIPLDGQQIATLASDDAATTAAAIDRAEAAFRAWRLVPAPRRGELVRLLGEELRSHKDALGRLF